MGNLCVITEDIVRRAYRQGIIKLVGDDETVCQIGDYWFWFGGETAEAYSAKEYAACIPEDTIIQEIYKTLSDFKDTAGYEYEYLYYKYFISENLK